jgi:hypothetical protein
MLGRIRNKGKLKAVDLVPPQLNDLKKILKRAELKYIFGNDIVAGTS